MHRNASKWQGWKQIAPFVKTIAESECVFAAYAELACCVNRDEFLGFPAGTLKLDVSGDRFERNGSHFWRIKSAPIYNPMGWTSNDPACAPQFEHVAFGELGLGQQIDNSVDPS